MSAAQLELVADGAELFKTIRSHTASSVPSWPTGLPDWYAPSLSLLLSSPDEEPCSTYGNAATDDIRLALGAGVTAEWLVERYPRRLTPWTVTDEADGTIVLRPGVEGPDRADLRGRRSRPIVGAYNCRRSSLPTTCVTSIVTRNGVDWR